METAENYKAELKELRGYIKESHRRRVFQMKYYIQFLTEKEQEQANYLIEDFL